MRSLPILALATLVVASSHNAHDSHDSVCKSPYEPFSTYCCHGVLTGPSVTAGNSSTLTSSAASDISSAVGGLTSAIGGLPSSITAHVPIPIHTSNDHAKRDVPSAVDSKVSDEAGKHTDETSLAPGVTCRGSVATLSPNNATTTAAAATTPAGAATSTMGIGASSPVSSSASGASTSASAGAAPTSGAKWFVGAGVGVGLGMFLL